MRVALRIFSLCFVLCLAGCAAAVVGGAAVGGYHVAKNRSADRTASDATITSTINTRYVKDELINAFDIRVHTYQGAVTLQGTVPSRQVEQRAVELARTVHGVKSVASRLVVVAK